MPARMAGPEVRLGHADVRRQGDLAGGFGAEPAKQAGAKVDDDLADLLLAEVRTGQPGAFGAGALPLLSHALDQVWRSRAGASLTLPTMTGPGGIDGAVAASAQRV